jgi:hypothetical protein
MWSVRILSGSQAGNIYDLKLGRNIFGRGPSCDLQVLSAGISKEHCEIHVYKDKMTIVDLKSSNGTFVNGVKIQNSIIRVGDKLSLFDIIMDVIPTPDIRPKEERRKESRPRRTDEEKVADLLADDSRPKKKTKKRKRFPSPAAYGSASSRVPQSYGMNYPQQGGNAMQMAYGQAAAYNPAIYPVQNGGFAPTNMTAPAPAPVYDQSFSEKIDSFMEEKVMPAIYRLSVVFSFKQVLQSFVLIFIFSVTLLAIFPLANIIKDTNLKEAEKRAKSVARALAKYNEAALLSGQLANLSVTEALKEEGIKEAFIVQQSDGQIVAPPEKTGRDETSSLVLNARKESRSQYEVLDSSTIGATFPISFYDPASGEASARFHAVVKYDISSLKFDEGRIVSLFMQTLIIACVLGMILYQLFARLIEYPLRSLNQQIDKAMLEKSDRTEVPFDYPAFQKLVSNVNTILNRAWSGESSIASTKPQQNKDLEFANLVEMISHAALVVDNMDRVVAVNSGFEQLTQAGRDTVVNQSYKNLTDMALVQNMESLVARSRQTPFEKHSDKIPFSQFECEIHCQVFLDSNSDPQYFVLTLVQLG